jgi:hypothetical protein
MPNGPTAVNRRTTVRPKGSPPARPVPTTNSLGKLHSAMSNRPTVVNHRTTVRSKVSHPAVGSWRSAVGSWRLGMGSRPSVRECKACRFLRSSYRDA